MSASTLLTQNIIRHEFATVIATALDLDEMPAVAVEMVPLLHIDGYRLFVKCGEMSARVEIDAGELRLSLDDFSQRRVIPMVSEMCGRPLLDEGRVILNPVQDAREAA